MNKLICDAALRSVFTDRYKFFLIVSLYLIQALTCFAQNTKEYKWWNPANNSYPVVEGRAWSNEIKEYDRLPSWAEKTLNPNVWNISHCSAGLYIKFKTNTSDIIVRYAVQTLKNLVEQIQIRQPKATILLSGILPRRQMEQRIFVLNKCIARLSSLLKVQYINPGTVLLNNRKRIDESLFEDGLHPNAAGYEKLGAQLANKLK